MRWRYRDLPDVDMKKAGGCRLSIVGPGGS